MLRFGQELMSAGKSVGSGFSIFSVSSSSSTSIVGLSYSQLPLAGGNGCHNQCWHTSWTFPVLRITSAGMLTPLILTQFFLKSSITPRQCINGVPINKSYLSMFTTSTYSIDMMSANSILAMVSKLILEQLLTVPNCKVTGSVRLNTRAQDMSAKCGDIAVDVLPLSHNMSAIMPLTLVYVDRHISACQIPDLVAFVCFQLV